MNYKLGQETERGRITGVYLRGYEGEERTFYLVNGEFIQESEFKDIPDNNELPKSKFELNELTSLGRIIGIQLEGNKYYYDVTESGKVVDFYEEDLLLCSEDDFED
ncbi:MAG: hypothetical protein AAF349_04780 [Cyanobacteria bacterium P01_A01_bin.68]